MSKIFTGLIFAKSHNSFLIFKSPCSGLTFAFGSLSNLGCPTAQNKIASLFLADSKVSSGKGSQVSSIAQAHINLYSKLNLISNFFSIFLRIFTHSLITSTQIPSQGITTIFFSIIIKFN